MLCTNWEPSHRDGKERKKSAIYVQAPAGSSFSDIHSCSEEDLSS